MMQRPRKSRPAISCVVPAYNEARNLGPLLMGLTERLSALSAHWEVIVVDDGSQDDTPATMVPWLIRPGIRYVRLSRNFGKEAALTAGIDRAEGDVVIFIDADLQHPVSLISQMLAAWHAGADMVCTARASRADEGWAKRLGTALFYKLVNRDPAVRIPIDAGDFRLMDRRVVDALRAMPERNRFMKGLYAWVGFDTVVIPYTPLPRRHGASSFSLRRLAKLAFTGITAFTNAPLRWWSSVGAAVAAMALAYGGWIVVKHLISEGIAELAMARRITAVSCITNAPHWQHAGARLQEFPDAVSVGLHFNLTEGKPLSRELAAVWPRLPTLPLLILRAHLGLIPRDALACEFAAQWASFACSTGRQPMFMDGHQHVHHLPGVRAAVFKVLDNMPVRPAIRNTARVIGPGFTLKRWLIRHTGGRRLEAELRRRGLAHNSCLLGTYDFTGTDYRSRMPAWLGALPDPGGLVYCHPGRDQHGDGHDPVADARVRELAYLSSDAFRQDLAAANVTLVRAWQ